jgi:uncharacterized protein YgbK (DUF1537 family)
MSPELGILADDLTGATDTGLQFAKCGRRTSVCLTWPASPACDVLVYDADSRNRPAQDARDRARAATRALLVAGVRRLYKKIDSTGRGNLGAEIEGMFRESSASAALVCPSFPQLGRTVKDGQILVQGVPLHRTEFAWDPLWPATSASLEAILRRQTSLPIDYLGLGDVRRGPARVRARLAESAAAAPRLVIADAESGLDLRCLAEAARQTDGSVLPVGSAGLAEWLVGLIARPARSQRPLSVAAGPILLVVGTMNRVGLGQVARLLDRGAGIVTLNTGWALDNSIAAAEEVAPALVRQLRTSLWVVLTLVDPRAGGPELGSAVQARGLSPGVATDQLMRALGMATDQAMSTVAPAAIVLTGGDTARSVCSALGTQALDVYREAAPGVPISLLQGGRWDGLPVVTKAGGFGDVETLVNVIQQLEALRT